MNLIFKHQVLIYNAQSNFDHKLNVIIISDYFFSLSWRNLSPWPYNLGWVQILKDYILNPF